MKRSYGDVFLGFGLFPIKGASKRSVYHYNKTYEMLYEGKVCNRFFVQKKAFAFMTKSLLFQINNFFLCFTNIIWAIIYCLSNFFWKKLCLLLSIRFSNLGCHIQIKTNTTNIVLFSQDLQTQYCLIPTWTREG